MHKKYVTFRKNDKEVIENFKLILNDLSGTISRLEVRIGESQPVNANININTIIDHDKSLYSYFQIDFSYMAMNSYIIVERKNYFLEIAINITNNANDVNTVNNIANLIKTVQDYFLPLERNESLDKMLGDELTEFYRKREESLLRLEEIAQNLINDTEKYRGDLDNKFLEKEENLLEKNETLKKELEIKYQDEKKRLEADIAAQNEKIREKEEKLKEREKEIDDSSSKHARRAIRKEMMDEIKSRNESFNLTDDTIKKRYIIHGTFLGFIGFFVLMIGYTLYSGRLSIETENTYNHIKLFVLSLGFAATMIYYIRWNDNWFRRHADEEFDIKRFQLDLDRASWVVEMAMEWNEEKEKEIPKELIDRLTVNLFQTKVSEKIKHPSEEIISKLLEGSAELSITAPENKGSAKLTTKGK